MTVITGRKERNKRKKEKKLCREKQKYNEHNLRGVGGGSVGWEGREGQKERKHQLESRQEKLQPSLTTTTNKQKNTCPKMQIINAHISPSMTGMLKYRFITLSKAGYSLRYFIDQLRSKWKVCP